jgi:predicted 3-demethylubiquinone-9 3-methyltransferase (glyoxalase superfamily)
MRDLQPFLMFCGDQAGKAEEALNWYCSVFPDARVTHSDRYGPGDVAPEGNLRSAALEIAGRQLRIFDSGSVPHAFGFTPAISLWVECSSAEEIDQLAQSLGEGGSFLMPIDSYGFSQRFAWVADRYGVTWQLNLE